MKRFPFILIMTLIARICLAQNQSDSIIWSLNLKEVVVEAPEIIQKIDRQLYIPKISMVKQSTDGADLLSKMKLPEVVVNKVDGTISIVDNSKITLCINGHPVTQEQIKSLKPENIKRIEFHDNPSMRWGESKKVVDFITRHQSSGGIAKVETLQAINHLEFQNFGSSANIYRGKSEWSASAIVQNKGDFSCYRDNIELFKTADRKTFTRTESGKPGNYEKLNQDYSLNYCFTDSLQLFEISSGYTTKNRTRDFIGTINNSLTGKDVEVSEHNRISSNNHARISMYYHRNLPNNQMLIATIGANYIRTNSKRLYIEDNLSSEMRVRENMKRVSAEFIYEKKWEKSRLSSGLNSQQSMTRTKYPLKDKITDTKMNNSYFFIEYMYLFGKNMDLNRSISQLYLFKDGWI